VIFWNTIQADTGRVEVIEAYHSVEDAIKDMSLQAWEEPSNRWADYLMDEQTGEAVGVAIFGPEQELLITLADGRRLTFEMPERYKE
jgi:hypothetical protein